MEYLRYYYTTMFEAHKNGGTLMRPLAFEFPGDKKCLEQFESTFMMGRQMKATLSFSEESTVQSYFPKETAWISMNDWDTIVIEKKGQNITFEVPRNQSIAHLREGSVFPL